MKKYLPSLDELIPFVIMFVAATIVWQLVSSPINDLIAKAKAKAS